MLTSTDLEELELSFSNITSINFIKSLLIIISMIILIIFWLQ